MEADKEFVKGNKEPLYSLSVDIKNKKNLAEALDLFIKPDILEGNNMYHCDKFDCKIRAQRRSFIDKLPDSMLVSLKRFEYDYTYFRRIKVNDYCEFPMELDFYPWTREGVHEREAKKKEEEEKKAEEDEEERKSQHEVKEVIDGDIEVDSESDMEIDHQSEGAYSDIISNTSGKKRSHQKKSPDSKKKDQKEEEKKSE